MKIRNVIPNYTLGEELINSISHGIGALLSIVLLIFLLLKCNTPLEYVSCTIFGVSMILLYTMSCIYHGLSSKLTGKKVLRVLDHCNVYLLVFGSYFPLCLLGIGGTKAIFLVVFVGIITTLGIVLTSISIDKFKVLSVIFHLLNGWSAIIGVKEMYLNHGFYAVLFLILGGVVYTIGAILYGIGSKHKYIHSVFHFFCILGTLMHFICLYCFIL